MVKIFKDIKDDSYEFKPTIVEIEETPLNPIGRSILWIVIAIIVFGVFWLFFAKVDIVVSASGKYIPSGNIKILKPLESGIISKILVKEGDKVKAKQPLIVIDPSVSTVNLTTKKENLKALKYSITRLELLVNKDEFIKDVNLSIDEKSLYINQKTNYDETISQYSFKIEQLINSIKANEEEIKKLTLLKDIATKRVEKLNRVKEIIAYKEYEDAKSKELDLKSQLIVSNEKLLMEKARLNEIKTELDVFKSSSKSKWMDELLNKQKEASLVRAEINALTFQTKQQIISSPVDGYVGKLLVHTIGSSINNSEELLSIIPSDEPLIISANMLNRDVGFLKLDQNVSIKVDAFNFQKYGKIDGKLIHIANDSIKDEKLGEIYEIKVKPLKTSLMVDGELKQMEPGMSVVAEVKVGKRRVIELFIYPIIKYLDEGLSVK
ncbi:type I secretion system membrane fusion protein, HlyD family [Campylobacter blaseri]|uniref:Secretion protein HylD n=1 Tax=Campylobacter blaseri TaxID=2042961 RepID=A0A2P8QYD5_9BACT|nr:HlyD family type I secretion periplasmic adaptor subunit [Campylobacter blaseri]PSM51273.1 secretion protein HylD [Campylobacter blaseri]PSM52417.1 secretion protein HylD [Campylobacter blaseri]QKF86570.1 type I secretion system membrane fusion protein, HlyD family [Campylobacter blaseri]